MSHLNSLYKDSLALLTDLYQLTMAKGYRDSEPECTRASFNLFFRNNPFGGGYAVAAGIETAIEYVENLSFSDDDIRYLSSLTDSVNDPLLDAGLLQHLKDFRFSGDIHAVREGTIVFPHEPIVRVEGPIIECQLIETALLNIINFQTLIATKARRVSDAADGDAVLEFGMRRAQGIDGSTMASRAAYIGGCTGTSNVLAGKLFGIPIKGTHAHSWVMTSESEKDAFRKYAESMPNNCVFLVDTYDTIKGVKNAIEMGEYLRSNGSEMLGIRLDSGDLLDLSRKARKMLDDAGFPDAFIAASNGLDEYSIKSLKAEGSPISVWGVGTKLATSYDQPALGGVYKMSAINTGDGWKPRLKVAENPIKTSIPGRLQVFRYTGADGLYCGDAIVGVDGDGVPQYDHPIKVVDPMNRIRTQLSGTLEPLLRPALLNGERPASCDDFGVPLESIRDRVVSELSKVHPGIRWFGGIPRTYPVGLTEDLHCERDSSVKLLGKLF